MPLLKTDPVVISVVWVDRFSLSTLCGILQKGLLREGIEFRFVDRTYPGWIFFKCLRSLRIIKGKATRVEYSMGDMRLGNGESLQYGAYRVTSETTVAIVEEFKRLSVYKRLASLLPQDKLDLYLEKYIYNELFSLIRLLCIVQWHIRNVEGYFHHIILWPEIGFFSVLQHIWPDKAVSLASYKPLFDFSWIRSHIKKLYHLGQDLFASILPKSLKPIPIKEPSIAVHYAEGIDLNRRSDLFWYPESRIDPERVVIYFDRPYNHPITKEHIRQIESMGMHPVSLSLRRDIPLGLRSVWRPPLRKEGLLSAFKKETAHQRKGLCQTEKWLFNTGIDLLKDVEYWQAFYRFFNVRVHHDPVEAGLQNVAQNIALDLVGGIRVGKQRSELFIPISDMIGYYPDHVFFSWNSRAFVYLEGDRNRNDYCIVSGFAYDATIDRNKKEGYYLWDRLKDNGARFVVALYDNMFGKDLYYSKGMMQSFYRSFLEWVLEDREVGLVIKSKKPHILDALPEIQGLLTQAKATSRCIQLDSVYRRLASDAAHGADIAVGIGISSAVIEAVITGCKGVHYDVTGLHSHPFYDWGYERIIFNDIDRLIESLKGYKKDPNNKPELGDWLSFINGLDPFRDGRSGERIGTYFRWFLEAIDGGEERNTALKIVNKRYAEVWGRDKVIPMRSISPRDQEVLQEDRIKIYG